MLSTAEDYYRQQQALSLIALTQARKAWDSISPDDINSSWAQQVITLLNKLTGLQFRAAEDAIAYIDQALNEQGVLARPMMAVSAPSFSGVASDGRSLATLLDQPRIQLLTDLKTGTPYRDASRMARAAMDRLAVSQIQDAGRVAAGVAITVRPHVTGYVRMLNPPSCSRCVILAGKHYKWNAGFQRHPLCNCFHMPVASDGADLASPVDPSFSTRPEITDPDAYFKNLTPAMQDATFGKAGAQAIRDGASIGQVVNARQGIDTASGRKNATTSTGTGRQSLAGQRLIASGQRNVTRLMPEAIYQIAGNDRVEAMRLLHLHGYVI